jgi:CheY-like chemotaxis protein
MMPGTDELRGTEQRERPVVLIAEDEQELRQLYAQQLTISGFEVIVAANGAEAIDLTSARLPDVILMDLSMPVVDGWEATKRLRANTRTAHIPVVALTAHVGAGELLRATSAGCDWFVPKPCAPAALITEIRRVLSAPRPPSSAASATPVPPSP